MIDMSERATDATQSFGQPANLILDLYGNIGRCSSSWYSVRDVVAGIQRVDAGVLAAAGPTQQLGVRMSEPEPPRSKPISVRSSKTGSSSRSGRPAE